MAVRRPLGKFDLRATSCGLSQMQFFMGSGRDWRTFLAVPSALLIGLVAQFKQSPSLCSTTRL
jgi:hypothetical protein